MSRRRELELEEELRMSERMANSFAAGAAHNAERLRGERDAALSRAEAAERERDEALADAARLREKLHRLLECYEELAGFDDEYEAAAAPLATPAADHLAAALDAAYRAGEERMRERAASVAQNACLVPPDGGSPSDEEIAVANDAAAAIAALKPEGQG